MSIRNLWGDLPSVENLKAPAQILKEQAAILAEQTKGVLIGKVEQISDADLAFDLDIRAPALNNHSVNVLRVTHPVTLYPVRIYFRLAQTTKDLWECPAEADFLKALESVLSGPETKRVLASLMVLSR
ncbi:MAG TPA: hypothetical protein VHH73_09040 [Verrucomicrobiae bacterium]|nr:hypothetical protein [Verrucomicrobiae bacterium]